MAERLDRLDKQIRSGTVEIFKSPAANKALDILTSPLAAIVYVVILPIWALLSYVISLQCNEGEWCKKFDPYPYNFLALLLGAAGLGISTMVLHLQKKQANTEAQEEKADWNALTRQIEHLQKTIDATKKS
jgi:uncharacterized membrane protein